MYFTIMNMLCFGMIGYFLVENGITYQDFSFWSIFALVIIIQILPVVCFKDDDTK